MFAGFRLDRIGDVGGWFFRRIVAAEISGGDGGVGFLVGGEVEDDIGERIGRAEMKRTEVGMWVGV